MKQHKYFKPVLKWWILFCSVIFATAYSQLAFDLFAKLNAADVTKLTFVIIAVFFIYMTQLGSRLSKFCKNIFNENNKQRFLRIEQHGWFISDIFMAVGFLGTLIGFIFMLDLTGFGAGNEAQTTLITLVTGMKTAIYTTVIGLIGSMIIKIVLYIIRNDIETIDGYSLPKIGDDNV
jgi:hypothetical protein